MVGICGGERCGKLARQMENFNSKIVNYFMSKCKYLYFKRYLDLIFILLIKIEEVDAVVAAAAVVVPVVLLL